MIVAKRILLVEDDQDIARLLEVHLVDSGAHFQYANSGDEGLSRSLGEHWDLIILDLGLPGVDGIQIATELRKLRPSIPVLMVTARSSEAQRILGLDAGADDYIVKPFSMLELVARIRALFRRIEAHSNAPDNRVMMAGGLLLDEDSHSVSIGGVTVPLTAREFGLLAEFMGHPGKVFSRSELLERVWGSHYQGYRHTVNTHINRLRTKIEPDSTNPLYIQTVWGVGYKLNV